MRKFLILLTMMVLVIACKEAAPKEDTTSEEAMTGEKMEAPMVELKDFEAKAASFVDEEIVTKGIVDHVCRHGGKRLFLVSDDADLHVDGEERFDENLNGSEIEVKGVVREFRVDEAYCLKMESDNIEAHNNGDLNAEQFGHKQEQITFYRDSMKVAGVDHLSFYSMDYLSHKEIN